MGTTTVDRQAHEDMLELLHLMIERSGAATRLAVETMNGRPESFGPRYNQAAYAALADESAQWTDAERTRIVSYIEEKRWNNKQGLRCSLPSFRLSVEDRLQVEAWAKEMGETLAEYQRNSTLVYAVTPERRRQLAARAEQTGATIAATLDKILDSGLRYL